ncbi:MAG: hypothetical protein VR66_15495, partial [Peptococcaceae bacterium BRH_c23]
TIGGTDSEINTSVQNAATSLDPANLVINITPNQALRLSGQGVTIQVSYPVQLVIPIISAVIPNPVVVSSSIVMRLE